MGDRLEKAAEKATLVRSPVAAVDPTPTMTTTMTPTTTTNNQKLTKMHRFARIAHDAAAQHWGTGWRNLTDDMREAFVAREALHLLMNQCSSIKKFAAAQELIRLAMNWGHEQA